MIPDNMAREPALAVIVNYNAGSWLKICVDSIRKSDYPMNIALVDNASTDDSVATLAPGNDLNIVQNSDNLGFSRANNQILNTIDASFYVLINPDCRLEQATVGTVIEAMLNDERIGLASCIVRNLDGSIQKTSRRRFPTPASALVRVLGLAVIWPNKFNSFDYGDTACREGVEYVEAISGAFMVVRGSALKEVGGLDEGYFMHCEDLDWCKRFWHSGYKVASVSDADVTHAKGGSGRSVRVNWHLHQGMLRFYRKFYLKEYPTLLYPLIYLGVFLSFTGKSILIVLRGIFSRGNVSQGSHADARQL